MLAVSPNGHAPQKVPMREHPRSWLVARVGGEPRLVLHCPRPSRNGAPVCGGVYEVDQAALRAAQREGRASNADVYLVREQGSAVDDVDVRLVPGGHQSRPVYSR